MFNYFNHTIKTKKIFYLILMLGTFFIIFTNCNKNNVDEIKETNLAHSKDKLDLKYNKNFTKFPIKNVNLLYYGTDIFIYSRDVVAKDNVDCVDMNIYIYNINTGKSNLITKIKNFNMTMGEMNRVGEILYYPYISLENGKEKNYTLKINLKTLSAKKIKYKKNGEFAIGIKTNGKKVFRHYIVDGSSGKTDYYIDRIDENGDKQILHTNYWNGKGEKIISIYSEQDKIYAYVKKEKNKQVYHFINQYNMKGQLEKQHQLKLDSFLWLEEIEEEDTIFNLYKIKNYFILHTINGRNLILKQKGEQLFSTSTPKELYDIDLKANILYNYDDNATYLYFQCIAEPQNLIIFNTNNGNFSSCTIASNKKIANMYNNVKGNLLIETKGKNNKNEFYQIDKVEIEQYMKQIYDCKEERSRGTKD